MDSQLKAVTFLSISTCITVLLDIQMARQILGFCFLSFVPGYLLLRLLKLSGKNFVDTLIFSVGLSISYVMFAGLLLNTFFVTLNLSNWLSTPLLASMFGSTFVFIAFCHFTENKEKLSSSSNSQSLLTVSWISVLFLLPLVGIIGAVYHNALLTMAMIIGIAALFLIATFWNRIIPETIFPLLILSASIALLLNSVLISKYLIGSDIFSEFYVYRTIAINGYWLPSGQILSYTLIDSLNSLLSITILPAIYVSLTGISADVIFKVLYPFIFSLVPLALFRIYEQQLDKKSALLSVFSFVSISVVFFGYEPLSLDRQIAGQFFLIISILLLLGSQIHNGKKEILLIVFGASIIVSHYSMAYVFLAYLISFYIVTKIRIFPSRKASMKSLHLGTVLLMVVLTFAWYAYVSSSPLNQLGQTTSHIVSAFTSDFSNLGARGFSQGALQSVSPLATTTLEGAIDKALFYLENLFLAIGVLLLIIKPDEFSLNSSFRLVAIMSALFLLLGFAIPNLATTLNMTRFYAILLPFLAPFIVLGGTYTINLARMQFLKFGKKIGRLFPKAIILWIMIFVLLATFLFQTGFIGHVTNGYPYSYSLDLQRRESSSDISIIEGTHANYFLESEVLGAAWLERNLEPTAIVYSDYDSARTVLKSYAHLSDDRNPLISQGLTPTSGTFVYLKYLNTILGRTYSTGGDVINTTELQSSLATCDKIYSNGVSEIYYSP
jgi:uncharacterized membrane protein